MQSMHSHHPPVITIVTPSYNQGEFIRQTIDSVLSQEYPGLDYQVRDGGSTDGTLSILKSYGDDLKWFSEPDRGQAEAINKGWKKATGEIVAWLNSDDQLCPGALTQVSAFFSEHPEVDILYGDCDCINKEGKTLMRYPTETFNYRKLVLTTINYIPQPTTFIRKRVLDKIGLLDETLHYGMDFDYWLRAGIEHRFEYLPTLLAKLRIHPKAKSSADLDKFGVELTKIYQQFFANPNLPAPLRMIQPQAMSNIYYRAADCSLGSGNLRQARQQAWKSWLYQPTRLRRLWVHLALGKLRKSQTDARHEK
jgi:glycosyltransferase involved in cell wall biosynthesis